MHKYTFEWLEDYTLTEYTIGLLVCSGIVFGFEIRPNFPPDDKEFPGVGGCVGVILLGKWFGWTNVSIRVVK